MKAFVLYTTDNISEPSTSKGSINVIRCFLSHKRIGKDLGEKKKDDVEWVCSLQFEIPTSFPTSVWIQVPAQVPDSSFPSVQVLGGRGQVVGYCTQMGDPDGTPWPCPCRGRHCCVDHKIRSCQPSLFSSLFLKQIKIKLKRTVWQITYYKKKWNDWQTKKKKVLKHLPRFGRAFGTSHNFITHRIFHLVLGSGTISDLHAKL